MGSSRQRVRPTLARRGKTMDDYDAIIIGTGQSGPSLARRLVAAGQKVAVIERKFFGGTCVNAGCTPTKTLVASAYAAYLARRAGDYGVTIGGPVEVDMKAIKARKDAVAGASRRGVERSLKAARSTKAMPSLSERRTWRWTVSCSTPTESSSMWAGERWFRR